MLETSPSYYVRNLINILNRHGVDAASLVKQSRIRLDMLAKDDCQVSFEKYHRLVELALQAVHIPALGLKAGMNVPVAPHDTSSFICLTAPTLGDAMIRQCRFGVKPSNIMLARFNRIGEEAVLSVSVVPNDKISDGVKRYVVLEYLGSLIRLSDFMGVGDDWFLRVEIPFGADGEDEVVSDMLGCPIHWGADRLRFVFPARLMFQPINFKHDGFPEEYHERLRYLGSQYQLLAKEISQGLTLTGEINRIIFMRPSSLPNIDEMADILGISQRALQRRLRKEGTTYRRIILTFRMIFARFYLQHTSLPTSEIAYLLDYAEVVNFYRAFKKYFGVSTRQMRAVLKK